MAIPRRIGTAISSPARWKSDSTIAFSCPTTNDRVPQIFVEDHRVKNLDPADPLWVGEKKPSPDHPTGITHRDTLKMDWSHGHNDTIHNGISRIGFYTGGNQARFRDEDLADEWIKQSNRWIEQNKDRPFFLYFASQDIHVPRVAHERFQGKTTLGPRGDCILQLDWCVGELMKTLDRLGLAENTLVVFCSDNGPVLDDGYKDGAVDETRRTPARRSLQRRQIQRVGRRHPHALHHALARSHPPGVSDEIVCTIDLAASFAALTGQPLPTQAASTASTSSTPCSANPEPKDATISCNRTTAASTSASDSATGNLSP